MCELVVPGESELKRNAESFDGHDGDRAHRGADRQINQRIALAIERRDFVDHDHGEDSHGD